jgi:hypothetical protein
MGFWRGSRQISPMIALSKEAEALARRPAAAQSPPVDDAVRQALQNWARAAH